MHRLYFTLLVFTFFSCSKDKASHEPYFKFDQVGNLLFSEIKVNDTIKFAGSNGSTRMYNVFKIENSKETVQDCSWNFGTCVTYYHYDLSRIYFLRTDTIPLPPNSPMTSSISKQMQIPLHLDKKNLPEGVKARTVVYGGYVDFNIVPPKEFYPDFYTISATTTFSNSVKTYTDVVIIKSGNNSVYIDPVYGTKYTVNEVWFDKKNGIVFFKDVFGNSWSRTN